MKYGNHFKVSKPLHQFCQSNTVRKETATNHDLSVPDLVSSKPKRPEPMFCFEKWSLDPKHGQLWCFLSPKAKTKAGRPQFCGNLAWHWRICGQIFCDSQRLTYSLIFEVWLEAVDIIDHCDSLLGFSSFITVQISLDMICSANLREKTHTHTPTVLLIHCELSRDPI